MKIDELSVVVRPRSNWEATDLGIVMLRNWWRAVYKPWLLVLFGFVLLAAIPFHRHPGWVLFLVWWLKPLWDRIPLQVLSRAMFGSHVNTWEVIKALPKLALPGLFTRLTIFRFGPSRGVTLPVLMLEGLKGRRRSSRISRMARGLFSSSIAVGSVCLIIELLTVFFGLFVLTYIMVPAHFHGHLPGPDDFFILIFPMEDTAFNLLQSWIAVGFYIVAVAIVEPLYVALCFGLYLNSRTRLEGWDIELSFRRTAQRLQNLFKQAAIFILAILLLGGSSHLYSQDQADVADVQSEIEEIMADPIFGHEETRGGWVSKIPTERTSSSRAMPSFGWLAAIFKVLLYAVLVALIAGIIYAIFKFIKPRADTGSERKIQPREAAEVKLGEIVQPETLPDDPLAGAREQWAAGNQRLALSYLFRGALLKMALAGRIAIADHATEGECLNLVKKAGPAELARFFTQLTQTWQSAAYAHRMPDDAHFQTLCSGWQKHLPEVTS